MRYTELRVHTSMFENDLSDMHLLLFVIIGSYHFISTRYKASFV